MYTFSELLFFRHGLMLLWFADLMNVTEEVTIHRPNVSTPLSTWLAINGDLMRICSKNKQIAVADKGLLTI